MGPTTKFFDFEMARIGIFQNKCFLKQERENIRQQLGPKIEGESENIARIANAVHCHS